MRRGRRSVAVRKESRLSDLRDPSCDLCPLHLSSSRTCIMGRGNLRGQVMLLGEAPGRMEEFTGRPFTGPAGQLLDRILRDLDLQWAVYITNPAKCRPPDNRKPTPDELTTCIQNYWKEELKIISPKVIVALGRTAASALNLGHIKVQKKRRYYQYRKFPVILTWHPAYALRSGPSVERTLKSHLRYAGELANADLH